MFQSWLLWAGRLAVCGVLALPAITARGDEPRDGDENSRARPRDQDAPPAEGRRGQRDRRDGDEEREPRGPRAARQRTGGLYWLGIECFPAPAALREQLNLPEGQGLLVERATPDSPAAQAGVKKHDILQSADGQPLESMGQLFDLVQSSEGKALEFKLLRGGKELTVSVTPSKGGPPPGRDFPGRESLDRAWQQMHELQDQAQRQGDAIRMRFIHPGMVLPPGLGLQPALPDDMRITITREGKKPAEIEVRQGDETWKGTEEELDKAPEKFRAPVAKMLGRLPFVARVELPGGASIEAGGGFRSGEDGPGRPGREPGDLPGRGRRGNPEANLDERMRQLSREVNRIRDEIDSMRRQRGDDGDRKDPAPPRSDDAKDKR